MAGSSHGSTPSNSASKSKDWLPQLGRHGVWISLIAVPIAAVCYYAIFTGQDGAPSASQQQAGLKAPALPAVASCPDAADEERSCDFDENGAYLKLGSAPEGTKYLCIYPLPKDGNYVVTTDDGKHDVGENVRSNYHLLTAPKGERKRVRYFFKPTPAACTT